MLSIACRVVTKSKTEIFCNNKLQWLYISLKKAERAEKTFGILTMTEQKGFVIMLSFLIGEGNCGLPYLIGAAGRYVEEKYEPVWNRKASVKTVALNLASSFMYE